jgi:hypothetical protein
MDIAFVKTADMPRGIVQTIGFASSFNVFYYFEW